MTIVRGIYPGGGPVPPGSRRRVPKRKPGLRGNGTLEALARLLRDRDGRGNLAMPTHGGRTAPPERSGHRSDPSDKSRKKNFQRALGMNRSPDPGFLLRTPPPPGRPKGVGAPGGVPGVAPKRAPSRRYGRPRRSAPRPPY